MPLRSFTDDREGRLPDGARDVRGWTVVTLVDGEQAGVVHDLLIDAEGEPRYLDIDLGFLRRHVLLPIDQARTDPARQTVWVPGFSRRQFRDIPPYDHDLTRVTRRYEDALVEAYTSARDLHDRMTG